MSIATQEVNQAVMSQTLQDWELSRVRDRVKNEECLSDIQAKALEREYKRYIAIVCSNPNHRFPMTKAVDPFWHAHILHTKNYCAMCDRVNNGVYIHHEPLSEETDRSAVAESYALFRQIYRDSFKEAPPLEFWPIELNAECADGDSCESSCVQCR